MSDSNNPTNLGKTDSVEEIGTLDSFNPEDTYLFTLPTADELIDQANSFGRQLNKVQPTGYDRNISVKSSAPVIVSFGVDSNNNGIFEDNEIIAEDTLTDGTLEVFDVSQSLEDNLLDLGQNYFVEVESTDPFFSNSYEVTAETIPLYKGEIDKDEDSSYNFSGGRYYYDQIDEFALKEGDFDDFVEVGDEYSVSVISESSLNPVLFLLDKNNNNQVIDVAFQNEPETITLGGETYNQITLHFTVEPGINYTVSVESVEPGQTGSYYFDLS
ncbi:hypothetical protein IQ247_23335 [Plectonema cf. radiosum LEGE 06105]|uniref:Uncharacterized protein n=1 Tax=Plectonema cf. radiosum LEGE 06105 TaxID=945769 RepID=A0A8J7F3G7_9CYAN|nr:hypothetical protein [Plectonema radiosum]MBE9215563.1 hypothetical protein [Plectonema cf. radiosum LEGE 06105]